MVQSISEVLLSSQDVRINKWNVHFLVLLSSIKFTGPNDAINFFKEVIIKSGHFICLLHNFFVYLQKIKLDFSKEIKEVMSA